MYHNITNLLRNTNIHSGGLEQIYGQNTVKCSSLFSMMTSDGVSLAIKNTRDVVIADWLREYDGPRSTRDGHLDVDGDCDSWSVIRKITRDLSHKKEIHKIIRLIAGTLVVWADYEGRLVLTHWSNGQGRAVGVEGTGRLCPPKIEVAYF
jgi:hypothetical protein